VPPKSANDLSGTIYACGKVTRTPNGVNQFPFVTTEFCSSFDNAPLARAKDEPMDRFLLRRGSPHRFHGFFRLDVPAIACGAWKNACAGELFDDQVSNFL
jgi:hypothetical protein